LIHRGQGSAGFLKAFEIKGSCIPVKEETMRGRGEKNHSTGATVTRQVSLLRAKASSYRSRCNPFHNSRSNLKANSL